MHLTAADYAVTVTMLVIPIGIGVFYAWKDSNHVSMEEYLLGGRKMKVIPVAVSIFVTYQSAISIIGFTGETYLYGPMAGVFYIGNSLGSLIACYTMIPLIHPLQLTSIYEYLEMRYDSSAVRMFCTVTGMLQTFFYMVVALLAPGLALQAAGGIPFWMSVAVVGSIGTLYTAIGGIKSVIWTDVFQALVLFVGIVILIVRGTIATGGSQKVWDIAEQGGRTAFDKFSPDPRTRHSWWGMTIGVSFTWLINIYSQSNVQRVASMESVRAAKIASLLNIPCHIMLGVFLISIGIIIYSYFYVLRCDPHESGIISNINQISLYFMLHILRDYPGLAGFYMATLFSGALSTLSSGINALAANTVEDVMAGCLRGVPERKVIAFAKVMVFVYGSSIVGVAYLAEAMQGPVTQMTASIFGAMGCVQLGLFLIGSTVPWANKYGALIGGVISLVVNLWMVLGGLLHGRRPRPLPTPPTDQCEAMIDNGANFNSTSWSDALLNATLASDPGAKGDPYVYTFFLYDISYEWYAFFGTVVCSASILIISKLTNGQTKAKTDARLIIPLLRSFWKDQLTVMTGENELESMNI